MPPAGHVANISVTEWLLASQEEVMSINIAFLSLELCELFAAKQ